MIINQEFMDSLPDDSWDAALAVTNRFFKLFTSLEENSRDPIEDAFPDFIEFLSLYLTLIKEAKISNSTVEISGDKQEDFNKIVDFFKREQTMVGKKANEDLLKRLMEKYSMMLGKGFYYEFSDSDLKKIQKLVNELRELISASKLLTADHQSRLLKRLEKLQSELHKRTNDIDRLLGVVIDIGTALGRFGEKSKPFFDRLQQLGEIITNVMEKAQGLPTGSLPETALAEGRRR